MTRKAARTNEDLSAWLDGELEEGRAAELEAELQRDPELARALAELEGVVRLVREAGPVAAPTGFAHRVMARVDREEAQAKTSPWAWLRRPWGVPLEGWALGLAAVGAIALLVLPGARLRPPVEDEQPQEMSPAALERHDPPPVMDAPAPEATTAPVAPKVEIVGRTYVGDPPAASRRTGGTSEPGIAAAPPTAPEDGTAGADAAADPTPTTQAPAPAPPGAGDEKHALPTSVRMVVRSSDTRMKRQIVALAARYGGTPRQEGEVVTSARMDGSQETLTLSLSQGDLSSFTAEIRKLGYELDVATNNELVPGQTVGVRIDLELAPEQSLEERSMRYAPVELDEN